MVNLKMFLGTKKFYKEVFLLTIPVICQQLIAVLLNFADNIMVGQIGSEALAGVSVANKYYMIFMSMLFGLTGATGIFISQYFGADDKEKCQSIFLFTLISNLIIAIVCSSVVFIVPELTLELFVKESPATIVEGLNYIKYSRFCFFPQAITMACMVSLRSIGKNKVPMIFGAISIFTNIFLNWIFIYGNLGMPQMGAAGASFATLISRIIEMLLYIFIIAHGKNYFTWNLKPLKNISSSLLKDILKNARPLTANELLWSMGMTTIFWTYTVIDETMIPAFTIVDMTNNLMYVFSTALASASSIFIGKCLGAGKLEEAKLNASRMLGFSFIVGIFIFIVFNIIAPYVPNLVNVNAELKSAATTFLRIQTAFYIFNILYVCIFFILRAGGDTKSTFIVDSLFTWICIIPVALIVAFFFDVNIFIFFGIIQSINILKLMLSIKLYRKGLWIKNLVS